MKKTITICIIYAVVLAAVLSACTGTAEKSGGQGVSGMDNNQMLTIEYVIENTDLTAADFDGIDFAAFVREYALTKENIGEYYLPDLIAMYREDMADTRRDYSGIYKAASGSLIAGDLDKLRVLVWEYHNGNSNSYMVIDYDAKAVYYSQTDIITACRETDKVAELTEQAEAFVKTTLLDSGILEWENTYKGAEDATESWSWSVGIRLEDERCIVYSGRGIIDSNTPAQLEGMLGAMKKEFVK